MSQKILSVSVSAAFANRVEAIVESMESVYGKRNRAHTLRVVMEAGMEKIEKELSSKTYRPQPPTRKTEEMDAARAALKAEGWMISKAARRLGCNITTLRRRIERHAELDQEYVQRSPGSGRPSKKSRNP